MNYWIKLSLGLAAAGSLVGVWYLDEYYTKKVEEEKKISEKALNFETEKVRELVLNSGSEEFSFSRESATADWKFVGERSSILADQDAVNNFIAALKDMRREREMESVAADKLKDFGLDEPRRRVEISLEGGAKLGLEIGGDVQVGKAQGAEFKALSVYAVPADKSALYVIPSSALSQTEKKFSDFRTKNVVSFARDAVASFSFESKEGTVKVTKKDGNWAVSLLASLPDSVGSVEKSFSGDSNSIGLYLDRVARLRADAVIEQSDVPQDRLAEFGLSSPSRIVTFFNEAGESLQELKIGVSQTHAFLTMADGAIAQLAADQYPELAPEVKSFRDLKIMSGVDFSKVTRFVTSKGKVFQKEGQKWFPVQENAAASPALAASGPEADAAAQSSSSEAKPESGRNEQESRSELATLTSDFEFMRAKDIVDPENVKDDAYYGFDKPLESFTFEFSADSDINKIVVQVGKRVESDEKNIYLKRDGSPAVFITETTWMDSLHALDQAPPAANSDSAVSPQAKKEN